MSYHHVPPSRRRQPSTGIAQLRATANNRDGASAALFLGAYAIIVAGFALAMPHATIVLH